MLMQPYTTQMASLTFSRMVNIISLMMTQYLWRMALQSIQEIQGLGGLDALILRAPYCILKVKDKMQVFPGRNVMGFNPTIVNQILLLWQFLFKVLEIVT